MELLAGRHPQGLALFKVRHCALSILAKLLKRSLKAQKPKQRVLINFWSASYGK
jgi:hypothetical protein